MRLIKEPLQECLVYYRKCCNEAHKVIIPQTLDLMSTYSSLY